MLVLIFRCCCCRRAHPCRWCRCCCRCWLRSRLLLVSPHIVSLVVLQGILSGVFAPGVLLAVVDVAAQVVARRRYLVAVDGGGYRRCFEWPSPCLKSSESPPPPPPFFLLQHASGDFDICRHPDGRDVENLFEGHPGFLRQGAFSYRAALVLKLRCTIHLFRGRIKPCLHSCASMLLVSFDGIILPLGYKKRG